MKKLAKVIGWIGVIWLASISLLYMIYMWEGIGFIAWLITFPFGPTIGLVMLAFSDFSAFLSIAFTILITAVCFSYSYEDKKEVLNG